MNPLVKQALLALLQMLLALARTPPSATSSVKKQLQAIQDKKDEILTAHGDSEIADDEVQEAIDDLATVVASATPNTEYELDPDDVVDGESTPDGDDDAGTESDGTGDHTDPDAEEQKPEETKRERRIRLEREAQEAAEEEAAEEEEKAKAEKAKAKAKPTGTGTVKKKH